MNEKPTFKERLMKLRLTKNWGLKILALIIAIVLWLLVVNITDPVSTRTYKNVKVTLINSRVITENGKTLEIVDDTDVVSSVTVKAPRTVIQELGNSNDNIIAVADFEKLSADEKRVPIDVSVTKYAEKIETIKSSDSFISVNIENKKSVQLPITATTSGEVEEGFVIGDIVTAQNQVKVSGPESVIRRIAKASVDVQVTGFKENISTISDVILYDDDGREIKSENLMLNIENVRVDVEILATKTVPVYFSVMGIPEEGSELTGVVDTSVENAVIAGKQATLDAVAAINIPASAVNVSGQSSDMTVEVNIGKYLPAGIKLAEKTWDGIAIVTAHIEKLVEQKESVYLKNVEVFSGPDGFEIDWAEKNDYIEFVLTGLQKNLDAVKLSDLELHIDFGDYSIENGVTEFKPGIYELNVNMTLPEGVELKEPVTIKVKLTDIHKKK